MRRIVLIVAAVCLLTSAAAFAHPRGVTLADNYTGLPVPGQGFYRDLDAVKRAHLGILHLYVQPHELRSQRDVRYFTRYLRAARRDGIRVLLTVWQKSTAWMNAHPQEFAASCAEAARLWGPYLAALEVGNEPNDDASTDVGYVRVLRAAYPAIKQAAPNLPVIGGVLGYASGGDLEAMYAAGLHGYFDALSAHPYTDQAPPRSTSGDCSLSFACGVPWLRQIMVEHGDGDKKLWLTEMGWSTKDCKPDCVTEQKRATYMRQVAAMTRSWPWIGAVIFFQLRYGDPRYEPNKLERSLELGLALVSPTWQPTPGFWALARTAY